MHQSNCFSYFLGLCSLQWRSLSQCSN